MAEKINQERRNTLVTLSSGIVLTLCNPVHAVENMQEVFGQSKFVNYTEELIIPAPKTVRRLIGGESLDNLILKYRIPDNDRNLKGGMILTLRPNLTDILVRVKQKKKINYLIFMIE
ncbi:MAG: hypothetical protein ABIH59_02330 [archaeon]